MKSKLLQSYILLTLLVTLLGNVHKVYASDREWEGSQWWGRPVFSSGIPVGDLRCGFSDLFLHPDLYNDPEIKALKMARDEVNRRVWEERAKRGKPGPEIGEIDLEKTLSEQLKNLRKQRVERFYSNIVGLPESLESAKRESITTLSFHSNTIKTREDIDAIIGLLPAFPNLTMLSLSLTSIGPLVIYFLERTPMLPKLTRFDLVRDNITDEIIKALLPILPVKFPALKIITMFDNTIEDKDSLERYMRADERISFSIVL